MIKRSFQNENVPNGAPNIFEGEIDYKIESKSLHDFKIEVKFLAFTVLFSFCKWGCRFDMLLVLRIGVHGEWKIVHRFGML